VDENSPSSECLGLSVIPVGTGTSYVLQTNKLEFRAVQGYLFLVRLIKLVLLSVLRQILIVYFSTASYSCSHLYLGVFSPPATNFAVNT